jgi:2-polyprenyl-6-methoxyphenol hydroxylase-like FAD-dependent oxidoreductase
MADVWDGATTQVGVLTATFNTDLTAIRFSRSDSVKFADDAPSVICNTLAQGFQRAVEQTEILATAVEKIDQRFAAICRQQAQKYREAIAEPQPVQLPAAKKP